MPLHDLFLDELRDLYDAERQLTKALPKLAKGSASPDLRSAIESHLEETRGHVERLERAFQMLDERARGKHCAGIAGIIEEGSDLLAEDLGDNVMDAGIIAGAQRAEHYEMAAYGSVIAWAKAMGHDDVASLLAETLEEEKAADAKLTELAEGGINEAAATGEGEEEEEETGRQPASRSKSRMAADSRR
jgi:ferritin-like metal-binding protein YciE